MKKIIAILLVLAMVVCFVGCAEIEENTPEENSKFVIVEKTAIWTVVYHKDTRVMYAVSYGSYNCGTFTLLVNADGTPMLYDYELE